MKVSELWLKERVTVSQPIQAVSEQLTASGIEVDAVSFDTPSQQHILTLKIPPNRGDCLSIEGIAREWAFLQGDTYQPIIPKTIAAQHNATFPIEVTAPELCPRYTACILQKINPKAKTPQWLIDRLTTADLRPVSPVVDVLNYVMLELGQPMHAFDLATLNAGLSIRKSVKGERITLLDEKIIELAENTLVVADQKNVQAIAGIMGGLHSGVTDKTTAVLLESAYFEPVAIRLSAQRYRLKTDSAYRFERGVDPLLPKRALEYALALLIEIVGGECGPMMEHTNTTYLPKPQPIHLTKKHIQKILGITLEVSEVATLLAPGGFSVTPNANVEACEITVPSFRQDITLPVDVIEEIARIKGLHTLPSTVLSGALNYRPLSTLSPLKERLKTVLVNRGYDEVITYSFGDPVFYAAFQAETTPTAVALKNPISAEMAVMRMSLIPGLVQTVVTNQSRQNKRARFFELGVCFNGETENPEPSFLSGIVAHALYEEQWGIQKTPDFFDLKSDVEALLSVSGQAFTFEKLSEKSLYPFLHPGQSAEIKLKGQSIGFLGALNPALVRQFSLEGPVLVFEVLWSALKKETVSHFYPFSKFPSIRRDIAVLVDRDLPVIALESTVRSVAGDALQQLVIFDVYQGKGILPHQKSVAIGLILQDASRTLVDAEVNRIMDNVINTLKAQFNLTLRDVA